MTTGQILSNQFQNLISLMSFPKDHIQYEGPPVCIMKKSMVFLELYWLQTTEQTVRQTSAINISPTLSPGDNEGCLTLSKLITFVQCL